MTIGGVERSVPGFEKFSEFLADRNYSSLHIQSKVLENTGHSGTKSETYNRGMQYVFERPSLKLDAATLNKYTGNYQSANGNKFEIKNENNQLSLYSGSNKTVLIAGGENYFYLTSEFFNIYFKTAGGNVEGFQLERYGNTQFIKKIN
jgi:hypothetical protein